MIERIRVHGDYRRRKGWGNQYVKVLDKEVLLVQVADKRLHVCDGCRQSDAGNMRVNVAGKGDGLVKVVDKEGTIR